MQPCAPSPPSVASCLICPAICPLTPQRCLVPSYPHAHAFRLMTPPYHYTPKIPMPHAFTLRCGLGMRVICDAISMHQVPSMHHLHPLKRPFEVLCSFAPAPSPLLLQPCSFAPAPSPLLLCPCSFNHAPLPLLLRPCSFAPAPSTMLLRPCSFAPACEA